MKTPINPDTIKAVASLTDTLAALRRASRDADRATETVRPGAPEERYALQLGRMVQRLGDAIAAVPTELWLAMCNANPETAVKTAKAA